MGICVLNKNFTKVFKCYEEKSPVLQSNLYNNDVFHMRSSYSLLRKKWSFYTCTYINRQWKCFVIPQLYLYVMEIRKKYIQWKFFLLFFQIEKGENIQKICRNDKNNQEIFFLMFMQIHYGARLLKELIKALCEVF